MILCTCFYVVRKLDTPPRIDEYFNREIAIMHIKYKIKYWNYCEINTISYVWPADVNKRLFYYGLLG
jgi:hypothetical protein